MIVHSCILRSVLLLLMASVAELVSAADGAPSAESRVVREALVALAASEDVDFIATPEAEYGLADLGQAVPVPVAGEPFADYQAKLADVGLRVERGPGVLLLDLIDNPRVFDAEAVIPLAPLVRPRREQNVSSLAWPTDLNQSGTGSVFFTDGDDSLDESLLVDLLMLGVAPEQWDDGWHMIDEWSGRLFLTGSPEVLAASTAFMADLEARILQAFNVAVYRVPDDLEIVATTYSGEEWERLAARLPAPILVATPTEAAWAVASVAEAEQVVATFIAASDDRPLLPRLAVTETGVGLQVRCALSIDGGIHVEACLVDALLPAQAQAPVLVSDDAGGVRAEVARQHQHGGAIQVATSMPDGGALVLRRGSQRYLLWVAAVR